MNDKILKYFNQYKNLPIAVYYSNNEQMLLEVDYINNYFEKNYSLKIFPNSISVNILRGIKYKNGIYTRIKCNPFNLYISGRGNSIDFLKQEYKFEKIFTVDDIKNGSIETIIKYGVSEFKPSYNPRKLIYD